jgi:hypothetical protein
MEFRVSTQRVGTNLEQSVCLFGNVGPPKPLARAKAPRPRTYQTVIFTC